MLDLMFMHNKDARQPPEKSELFSLLGAPQVIQRSAAYVVNCGHRTTGLIQGVIKQIQSL